jgi:uncharacterized membrane protein YvbJ
MARKKRPKLEPPEVCPVCAEDVPRGSLACPECGADYNSGWRQESNVYDAVDLPDEDFDYDDFIRAEFGSAAKPSGQKTFWWIAGIILVVVFIVIYFYAAH